MDYKIREQQSLNIADTSNPSRDSKLKSYDSSNYAGSKVNITDISVYPIIERNITKPKSSEKPCESHHCHPEASILTPANPKEQERHHSLCTEPTTVQIPRLTDKLIKSVDINSRRQPDTSPEPVRKGKELGLDELKNLGDADFVAHIQNLINHNHADLLEEIPESYFIEVSKNQTRSLNNTNREGRFRYGDYNYVDRRSTLLHYAIEQEKTDCLQILARKLPELMNMEDSHCLLPIHLAAIKGDLRSIQVLTKLDEGLINKHTDGMTALNLAIGKGYLDCIKYIVENFPATIKRQNLVDGIVHWYDYQNLYELCRCEENVLEILCYLIKAVPEVFNNIRRVSDIVNAMVYKNKPDCIQKILSIDAVQQMFSDINSFTYFDYAILHYPLLFNKILEKRMLPKEKIEEFNNSAYKTEHCRLVITPHDCPALTNSIKSRHSSVEKLNLIPGSKANDYLQTAKAFMAAIDKVGVFVTIGQYRTESAGVYWSLGDASACIQIMDTLIDLGAKDISLFVNTSNGCQRMDDSSIVGLVMDKLRLLLSESESLTHNTHINRRGCRLRIIVMKDKMEKLPCVNFSFFNAFKIAKSQNNQASFITVRPYVFGKQAEHIITDIDSERGKANYIPLVSPCHSVIGISPCYAVDNNSENTTIKALNIEAPPMRSWGLAENKDSADKSNSATLDKLSYQALKPLQYKENPIMSSLKTITATAVDKLCTMGKNKKAHITVVYGLHHMFISPSRPLHQWVDAINKQLEANTSIGDKRSVVIAVFPNTDKSVIDVFDELVQQSKATLIDMSNLEAEEQLDNLPDGQIILAKIPSIPTSAFNKLVDCSDYPALTEGANLTSYLLQTGHPYLSLLPDGTTTIPQNIGDSFEAMKANALSYKLYIGDEERKILAKLLKLIKSEKYEEALSIIGQTKTNTKLKTLKFLWGAMSSTQNPRSKPLLTVEGLLKKCQQRKKSGESLGSRGMEALIAAVDPSLNCYVSCLNNALDKNSPLVNHAQLLQHHINQPFNSAVVYAITKFLQHKGVSCHFP